MYKYENLRQLYQSLATEGQPAGSHPIVEIEGLLWEVTNTERLQFVLIGEAEKKPEKEEEPVIGKKMEIVLVSFNGDKPIEGKVDTGASVCSLHAESIKIRNDPYRPEQQVVDFVYDGKKYSMGLAQHQAVSSADGGVGYRPVVQFTVKYDGKTYSEVAFNLNDRSEMEDRLLIGLNLLEQIGYKIDPKESVELSTEPEHAIVVEQPIVKDKIQADVHELYEYLVEQDVSFSDLLRHVKMHTIQIVENLE